MSVWNYLINVSAKEILRLPENIDHLDNFNIPQEAKWLIGFWLGKGSEAPRKKPTTWFQKSPQSSQWGAKIKHRIAIQLDAIRHWKCYCGDFSDSFTMEPVTWFLDPPYQGKDGRKYPHKIDSYDRILTFAKSCKGQVILCEQIGADWANFSPMQATQARFGKCEEVVCLMDNT